MIEPTMVEGLKPYVILCNCGCDTGFIFRAAESLYISSVSSDFGKLQENRKLSDKKLLKNYRKGKILADSIVSLDTLKEFLEYLKSAKDLITDEKQEIKNYSHIHIDIDKEYEIYSVWLVSDLKNKTILKGKYYRAFEIALDRDGYEKLVADVEKAVAKAKKAAGKSGKEKAQSGKKKGTQPGSDKQA